MELQCPLPEFDFDIITLGHGSGGILTSRLLQTGVFAMLGNPLLNEQHDGAIFEMPGRMAFSTDSYVVSPLFFPGGNIGELAINGTVNDLAMCGARAQYLSLSFIIEEGLPVKDFQAILTSIQQSAAAAGVQIVTGDTKVVERGKGDGIFINTSGVGRVHEKAGLHYSRIQPGDKIIISGHLASHGVAIMSLRQGLQFESDIKSDTAPLHHTVLELLERFGGAIHFLRDPTRGGVATVLNEMAAQSRTGIEIQQKMLPVAEAVGSACEMLGLDPLYVANEGVFIAVVDADSAEQVLDALRMLPYGENAAIAGEITAQHPGQVLLKSAIGGHRVVNMLPGEQLPRIC